MYSEYNNLFSGLLSSQTKAASWQNNLRRGKLHGSIIPVTFCSEFISSWVTTFRLLQITNLFYIPSNYWYILIPNIRFQNSDMENNVNDTQ